MKESAKKLLAAALLLCAAVFIVPVSWAGSSVLSFGYAGSLSDKFADTDQDGHRVTLTQAIAKGSFGVSAISITAEFTPADPMAYCADGTVKFDLVYSAAVLTMADLNQIYAFAAGPASYLCLDPFTGNYTGQVNGIYDGGSGRFENATGTYSTDFGGRFLDLSIGYGSITGTVDGTLSW